MPLIVFIKTVGISQKKYYKLYLIFVLAENLHTLCNLSCSPHDPYYYETNSPFLCTLTTENQISVLITETRPKKSFFLLFVVFIQLPMVCVTFSEKSYSVPIHTCAHSKSPPAPLKYLLRATPQIKLWKKSLVFKNEKWHMYTLELKNELKFIWILWLLLLICNHKEMCCKTCLNAS